MESVRESRVAINRRGWHLIHDAARNNLASPFYHRPHRRPKILTPLLFSPSTRTILEQQALFN